MDSLATGTIVGAGSFRCERCGYVMTVAADEALPPCPSCSSTSFLRASLFPGGAYARREALAEHEETPAELISAARALLPGAGEHLAFRDADELRVVALTREWTRIGRSLAADIRFDDATVSRRHALVVRQHDGVRVVDDRSLNGVYVNGHRVEWRTLRDGDELVVGRHRLVFLEASPSGAREAAPPGQVGTLG